MRLAIVGSRSITNIISVKGAWITAETTHGMPRGVTEIVSGGASGVDSLARLIAQENPLLTLKEFKPRYKEYRSATEACYARNQEIVDYCDMMLALWDGQSGGTIDVVKRARKRGIPVYFFPCWTNRAPAERQKKGEARA